MAGQGEAVSRRASRSVGSVKPRHSAVGASFVFAGRVGCRRSFFLQANAAVVDAELELCESQKERFVVLERAVEMAGKAEAYATRTAKIDSPNRMIRSVNVLKAKASRLTAEVAVEKARQK